MLRLSTFQTYDNFAINDFLDETSWLIEKVCLYCIDRVILIISFLKNVILWPKVNMQPSTPSNTAVCPKDYRLSVRKDGEKIVMIYINCFSLL